MVDSDETMALRLREAGLERLREAARALRALADRALEELPSAAEIGMALEERSPAASRVFLSAASSLAVPFTVGMGMAVESLDDEGCTVLLPDWARNRDADGSLHAAALTAALQLAASTYWGRHAAAGPGRLALRSMSCRFERPARGSIRAKYSCSAETRERLLFEARARGRAEATEVALAFDSDGRLVAEAEMAWELPGAPALEAGREV